MVKNFCRRPRCCCLLLLLLGVQDGKGLVGLVSVAKVPTADELGVSILDKGQGIDFSPFDFVGLFLGGGGDDGWNFDPPAISILPADTEAPF